MLKGKNQAVKVVYLILQKNIFVHNAFEELSKGRVSMGKY